MFRAIIFILIYFSYCVIYARNKTHPQYLIQGEYRTDNIDYDDTKKTYLRNKTTLKLSDGSSANFAYLYFDEKNESRYTWNLSFLDLSPHAEFILGNYSVNFAAGLLAGKKKYLSSDPFSSSLVVSSDKTFNAENSGNPLFSFRGISTVLKYNYSKFILSLNLFYSIRDRFLKSETYVQKYSESSIRTINSRLIKTYNYSEPGKIIDAGFMFQIKFDNNFILQFYNLDTDINMNNETIPWDFNKNDSWGIKDYYSYGFFAQYNDNYITLFTEYGLSFRDLINDEKDIKKIYDYGLLYGIKFKHPAIRFSLIGKNTGKNFYSLYSSGHNYPEKLWRLDFSIIPFEKLFLGTSVSSDKRLIPGYTKKYLPSIKREKLSMKITPDKRLKFHCNITRIEKDLEDVREKKYKVESSIFIKPVNYFFFNIFGMYQASTESNPSKKIGADISFLFLKYFKIQMEYSIFFISRENSVYSKSIENLNLIGSESEIERSINSISLQLLFKKKSNIFSTIYKNKFIGSTLISRRISIIAKIIF